MATPASVPSTVARTKPMPKAEKVVAKSSFHLPESSLSQPL